MHAEGLQKQMVWLLFLHHSQKYEYGIGNGYIFPQQQLCDLLINKMNLLLLVWTPHVSLVAGQGCEGRYVRIMNDDFNFNTGNFIILVWETFKLTLPTLRLIVMGLRVHCITVVELQIEGDVCC